MAQQKRQRLKRVRNLVKRGEYWIFRKKVNGKVWRVSTECKDQAMAERRAAEIENDIYEGKFGWKTRAVPTVSDWCDTFLAGCTGRMDPATVGSYRQSVDRLRAARLGPQPLDEVQPSDCEQVLAMLTSTFAQNTLRTMHTHYKSIWNRAIADGLIERNPWTFKMRKRVLRKRVLLVEEQPKLLAGLPPHHQRFVKVDLLTGLRNSELCSLTDDDVDYVRRRITVLGKGKKYRTVPLVPECAELLRAQQAARAELPGLRPSQRRMIERGVIFPLGRHQTAVVIRTAAAQAGLPGLIVHDLRRTFATRCANSGVPMKKLQEWMGHSTITITAEFYIQTDPHRDDDLLAAVRESVATPEPIEGTKVVTLRG